MAHTDGHGGTERPALLVKEKTACPLGGGLLLGGLDRRAAAGGRRKHEACANARVVMQPDCPIDDTEETTDPSDCAHGVKYGQGEGEGLRPAREVDVHLKRPRRYHASYMVGDEHDRVSFETAIEGVERGRARLRAELGEVEGVTVIEGCITGAMMMTGRVR